MRIILALAALCGALQAPSASASVFLNVTGTVSSVPTEITRVAIGDALTFSIKMDTTFDSEDSPGIGLYDILSAMGSIRVGSNFATTRQSNLAQGPKYIEIGNYSSGDHVSASVSYLSSGDKLIDGDYSEIFEVTGHGPESALSSDRLDSKTITSDLFSTVELYHTVINNSGYYSIGYSNIKWSLSPNDAAVPEPSSWIMMILGFGLIGYALRRKTALLFV